MYILNEMAGNSFMIFCSTCANTQRVALLVRNLGMTAIPLHGQMSQVCNDSLLSPAGAVGPGTGDIATPPHPSVCLSVCPSVCPSRLVFAL